MGPALMLLVACAKPEAVDSGYDFSVVSGTPADGATDATQMEFPTLTFSAPADPTTCAPGVIRLDAITRDPASGDATVDFEVDITVGWTAEDTAQIGHTAPLPRGWTYAVTVRGGEGGCLSSAGSPMAGFFSTFAVP